MRIFTASLATETNSFSPIPTSRAELRADTLFPARQASGPRHALHRAALGRAAARQAGRLRADRGLLLLGRAVRRRRCRQATRACAMRFSTSCAPRCRSTACCSACMARWSRYGYDDCEGDLIARVREIVGPKAIIGVELDPHCHLTEKRVRGADIVILFKEYPHTDFAERAEELVTLVRQGDPRRHQAGHVALRLRHDRRVSRPRASRAAPSSTR